jgi:hypothetical protein
VPVFRALEGDFELVVGNAQHIKNAPGRKTDVKDSEWIAHLVRCGLIRPSFVPPLPIRELRELTELRLASRARAHVGPRALGPVTTRWTRTLYRVLADHLETPCGALLVGLLCRRLFRVSIK